MQTSTVRAAAQELNSTTQPILPSELPESLSGGGPAPLLGSLSPAIEITVRDNRESSSSIRSSSAYKLALKHDLYVQMQALHQTQKMISRTNIRSCLDVVVGGGSVEVHELQNGNAKLVNLGRCKSPLCIYCNRKRASEASSKIGACMTQGRSEGSRLGFLTLGVNSAEAFDVGDAYDNLLGLWKKVFNSKWTRKVGLSSYARSLDFTARRRGTSGSFNLHFHSVFVIPGWVKESFDEIYDLVYERWARFAKKMGMSTSYAGNKLVEVESSDKLSDYVANVLNPLELVSNATKTSQNGLSLVDVLRAVKENWRDEQAVRIYRNLESGLKGRRLLAYSSDFKKLHMRAMEQAPDEGVEPQPSEDQVVNVVTVPGDVWGTFRLVRPLVVPAFLLQSRARAYFVELCLLYSESYMDPADDDLSMLDHVRVFKRLYEIDKQDLINKLQVLQ